jgi:hypothetical protein
MLTLSAGRYSVWKPEVDHILSGLYLRKRSTLDIDVLGYIGIF